MGNIKDRFLRRRSSISKELLDNINFFKTQVIVQSFSTLKLTFFATNINTNGKNPKILFSKSLGDGWYENNWSLRLFRIWVAQKTMAKTLVKMIKLESFIFVYISILKLISILWPTRSAARLSVPSFSWFLDWIWKWTESLRNWDRWDLRKTSDVWEVSWLFLEGSVLTTAISCKLSVLL